MNARYSILGSYDYFEYSGSISDFVMLDVFENITTIEMTIDEVRSDLHDLFRGHSALERATIIGVGVKNLMGLFSKCINLKCVELNGVVSKSTMYINGMFCGCTSLTSVSFVECDFSSVLESKELFMECSSLVKVDCSDVNLKSVVDASYMFNGCNMLENVAFAYDFDSLVLAYYMFRMCTSIKSISMVLKKEETRCFGSFEYVPDDVIFDISAPNKNEIHYEMSTV